MKFGPNAMPDVAVHLIRNAFSKFWAPVPCLLELVIAIELYEHSYIEAGVILVLLVFNAVLSLFRESRSQAALTALRSRLALTASVRRDGAWLRLPAAGLVQGDLIKLSLGGVVPADVRLLGGSVLLDQSMLTGESIPVEAGPGYDTFAGALVRRGEATARVTAIGAGTKFGRTAELVRTAHVKSTQEKVVFRVVRNLAIYNGTVTILLLTYAALHGMHRGEMIPLVLTAVLTSIPVALPATFTLAAALGANALAKAGVLPTRLSAVDEAATMDVLCADKTGTLTRNELAVSAVKAMAGYDEPRVLGLAALASSDGGQDPVDAAIRAAASKRVAPGLPALVAFQPFDSATKMSEATTKAADGAALRIVKGSFAIVAALAPADPAAASGAAALESQGFRVLALAVGLPGALRLAGIIALSDPPRAESAGLIKELTVLGVRTIMITGDAPATAASVAHLVGLDGPICPPGNIPTGINSETFAVFAGVLPEDKFLIVREFQRVGHTVGMCGDGANDAPALRQAQMGIAVSTATDVAKSAAGIVLTEPGLGGIVTAVQEGRMCFERILTYILRSVTHKFVGALFLAVGLIMTGHAILTPLLLVISMIPGDFIAMLATTDRVRMSAKPSVWRVGGITGTGAILGFVDLIFCTSVLGFGKYRMGFDLDQLRTLAIVTLVFSGQAILYVVRERRRMWSSRPSGWLMISSAADLLLISTLAGRGILMTPLPVLDLVTLFGMSVLFAGVLDFVKVPVMRQLKLA